MLPIIIAVKVGIKSCRFAIECSSFVHTIQLSNIITVVCVRCNIDYAVVQTIVNKMRTMLAMATDNILVISRCCTHQFLSTYLKYI